MYNNKIQQLTKKDKINLLQFITRASMFVYPEDENSIVNFIHGYEYGTKNKCKFKELLIQLLTNKYKINYDSLGWRGQIIKLSKKLSLSWVTTFKRIALEIIMEDYQKDLDNAMIKIIKSRIESLLGRVNSYGDICFNDMWKEEWVTLCPIKSKWFKQLWTEKEWKTIKSIDKLIQSDGVFQNKGKIIPTLELLSLKEQYDKLKSNIS